MKNTLTLVTVLFSSASMAHPGHMPDESVHSMLHMEHIIALVTIVVIAVIVKKITK